MEQKDHYAALDGLRGIAAVAVVLLHYRWLSQQTFIPRSAYLAVDFFFILSGFVIAYAYDKRLLAGMGLGEFLRVRLVRLYPMLFLGALLGGIFLIAGQLSSNSGLLGRDVMLTALSFLLLPAGLTFGLLAYPVNTPIWSLFFEIVANVFYALVARRLRSIWGLSGLIACVALLTTLAWHYGSIELLGIADGPKFLAGFVRVTVPFFLGAFLFHSRIFQRFPAVPFYAVVVILLSVFFARISVPWLYDLLAVLLIFPAVVCLGARSPVSTPGLRRFCEVSGRISYPLYLLHQPIIRGVIAIFQKLHLPVTGMLPMVFTVVLALACSWAALKFYDEPVRAFLSQRTPRRATESGARACDATS